MRLYSSFTARALTTTTKFFKQKFFFIKIESRVKLTKIYTIPVTVQIPLRGYKRSSLLNWCCSRDSSWPVTSRQLLFNASNEVPVNFSVDSLSFIFQL
jgi:hypothetical protein